MVEGCFEPSKVEGHTKLKHAYYYSQKNNRNPDGSENMSAKGTLAVSKWGRFNQCFISTTTAVHNQIVHTLIDKGFKSVNSAPYLDEFATLLTLSFPGKDWPEPNRYLFDNHRKLVENSIKSSFPGLNFEIKFDTIKKDYITKIKENIEAGFQPWLSVKTFSGSGHLLSPIGVNKEMNGLWMCDPAGDIRKNYSSLTNIGGRDIFYDKDILSKIVVADRVLMCFKLKP